MNDSWGVLDFADRDRRNANHTKRQVGQVSQPLFHGTSFEPEHDEVRLFRQMQASMTA